MSVMKSVTVDGVTYESKTAAVVALLGQGVKKAAIVKELDTHYPFVLNIEKKLLLNNSPEGQAAIAAKAAAKQEKLDKKAAEVALKAEAKLVRAEAKLETQAKKAAKKSEKVVTAKVPKAPKAKKVVADDEDVATLLGDEAIPAEILADMKADGLVA